MAPPQRRAEPNTFRLPPTSPSSRRPQMYNLAGHALSSGSLLPRSTENVGTSGAAYNGSHTHLAATPPTGVASGVGVSATDAPYLTNLESHFGRVTLTAPDNMRRKQAKDKKQKIRQKKAQTAQVAAAALAGFDPSSSSTHASYSGPLASNRNLAAASSSNLLDPDRRYQATIDDGVGSTRLLAAPAQPGMRRAYSGNQTAMLTSIAHSQPSTAAVQSPASAGARRVRRRRASTARGEESSRPASRASGPSRPDSSLSHHQDSNPAAEAGRPSTSMGSRSTHAGDERPARSRSDSAPAAQEVEPAPSTSSQAVQQTSLHRQNVWNDIIDLDPNDLPPPFPEGAPRPPDPPLPPPHSSVSQDQQLIGPQPHARIPDSPPPPFRSDPESEADDPAERRNAANSASPASSRRRSQRRQASSSSTRRQASLSHVASRTNSSASESSASEAEPVEVAEERRAWEADIRNGLSFEVRLLREQQRRVARERAAILLDAGRQSPAVPAAASQPSEAPSDAENVQQGRIDQDQAQLQISGDTAPTHVNERLSEDEGEQADDETDAAGADLAPEVASDTEEVILTQEPAPSAASAPSSPAPPTTVEQPDPAREPIDVSTSMLQPQQNAQIPTAPVAPTAASAARPVSPETRPVEPEMSSTLPGSDQSAAAPAASITQTAPAARPNLPLSTSTRAPVRSTLYNETRLGLPSLESTRPVSASTGRPSSSRIPHRKTNSDSRSPSLAYGRRSDLARVASQGSRPVSAASSTRMRILSEGARARGHDSDSNLPLSRRPEDTLFVISAPPPAIRSTSDGDTSPIDGDPSHPTSTGAEAFGDSSDDGASQDDGAESDSSMEQWLAEAAAFDALRKKEEEASNRLRALREADLSDSEDDQDGARMPGGFSAQDSNKVQAVDIDRKMLDPASLAMMDSVLPKAPPPLVLGRSRGGAAYSDSSSDSTDTDEALDQYSSSEEGGDAYQEALTGHERTSLVPPGRSTRPTTFSEPDLTGVHEQPPLPPRPSQSVIASDVNVPQGIPSSSDSSSARDGPVVANVETIADLPAPSNGVARSLSLKAKGKLPERDVSTAAASGMAKPQEVVTKGGRAGDFEEDTSSSRDVSEDERLPSSTSTVVAAKQQNAATPASLLRSSQAPASFSTQSLQTPGNAHSLASNLRRSSLEPLFQPLSYGSSRIEVSNRLKGLFGQPLVAPPERPPSNITSSAMLRPALFVPEVESGALPPPTEAVSSLRRRSSTKSDRLTDEEVATAESRPSSIRLVTDRGEDGSGLEKQSSKTPFTRQKSIDRSSVHSSAPTVAATHASGPVFGPTPEQKAAQEALAQIAQLNTTTSSRQDSLAALERLLAKTSRPTSMIPSISSASRSSVQGPRQLTADIGAPSSHQQQSEQSSERDHTSTLPDSSSGRLSRQGAISRGKLLSSRNSVAPAPPPITYRTTGSTRPMSFVNPRSSAAPLPRGRLPAITDATRHFPPAAPTPGPVPTPSWLAHIPSEERSRLPIPLEPNRLPSGSSAASAIHQQTNNTDAGRSRDAGPSSPVKVAGSRVSAMISRFEPPSAGSEPRLDSPKSPLKSSAPWSDQAASSSSAAVNSALVPNNSSGSDPTSTLAQTDSLRSEPSVFRRFSQQQNPIGLPESGDSVARRRPPPRPPSQTNPFRQHSQSSANGSAVNPGQALPRTTTSMEDLAKQLDEAAASWSQQPFRNSVASQLQGESGRDSHLSVPGSSLETSQGYQTQGSMSRSPRTLAMESLTRRESLNDGASTPPRLPPKSPIMTPEQILAAGSRNGLSASIAAAQAAAFARRDHYGGRSQHAANNGLGTPLQVNNEQGEKGAEQRTTAGNTLRSSRSDPVGLGIHQASGSMLPAPSPSQSPSSPVSARPLPTLPASVRQTTQQSVSGAVGSADTAPVSSNGRRLPMPPPLPNRPRGRDWGDFVFSPTPSSAVDGLELPQSSSSRILPSIPISNSARTDIATRPESSHRTGSFGSDSETEHLEATPRIRSRTEDRNRSVEAAAPTPLTAEPAASPIGETVPIASSSSTFPSQSGPRREASLGITDFDLLVAQLERDGAHFEQLSAIGEFLGPAKRTSATAEELANLSVAKIECDSRRVTKEGKIKQKLSCVGVRVDKCAICLNQFKQDQMAVILPCSHIFHEGCARQLFQQRTTCPTCRRDAFEC